MSVKCCGKKGYIESSDAPQAGVDAGFSRRLSGMCEILARFAGRLYSGPLNQMA